jgi:hypothetical protein
MSLEQAPLLLPSFQDGVLFGKLIQKLERKGNELSFLFKGFTEYPKNRAQKLQNIRKVLSFLVREKKIPESAGGVSVEEEILEGNSVVIIDLLLKIRDVYRLKTRYAQWRYQQNWREEEGEDNDIEKKWSEVKWSEVRSWRGFQFHFKVMRSEKPHRAADDRTW